MPPDSLNPDTISDQKVSLSTPVFRPGLPLSSQKLCHLLRTQTKYFLKSISNSHISLSFLFIWNGNGKYVHDSRRSLENPTQFQTKKGKMYIRLKSIPVFRPGLRLSLKKLCHPLILEREQKDFLKCISIWHISLPFFFI